MQKSLSCLTLIVVSMLNQLHASRLQNVYATLQDDPQNLNPSSYVPNRVYHLCHGTEAPPRIIPSTNHPYNGNPHVFISGNVLDVTDETPPLYLNASHASVTPQHQRSFSTEKRVTPHHPVQDHARMATHEVEKNVFMDHHNTHFLPIDHPTHERFGVNTAVSHAWPQQNNTTSEEAATFPFHSPRPGDELASPHLLHPSSIGQRHHHESRLNNRRAQSGVLQDEHAVLVQFLHEKTVNLFMNQENMVQILKALVLCAYNAPLEPQNIPDYQRLHRRKQELEHQRANNTMKDIIELCSLSSKIKRVDLFGSKESFKAAITFLISSLKNPLIMPTKRYAIFQLLDDKEHFGMLLSLTHMLQIQNYRIGLAQRTISTLPRIEPYAHPKKRTPTTRDQEFFPSYLVKPYDLTLLNYGLFEAMIVKPLFTHITLNEIMNMTPYTPRTHDFYSLFDASASPLLKALAHHFAAHELLFALERNKHPLTDRCNPEVVRHTLELALFFLDSEEDTFLYKPTPKGQFMQHLRQAINSDALALKALY